MEKRTDSGEIRCGVCNWGKNQQEKVDQEKRDRPKKENKLMVRFVLFGCRTVDPVLTRHNLFCHPEEINQAALISGDECEGENRSDTLNGGNLGDY